MTVGGLVRSLLLLTASSAAGAHEHPRGPAADPGAALAIVTINPEARISVAATGVAPPPARCGTPMTLQVHIINEAGVTASLRPRLVGQVRGAHLSGGGEALTGRREEDRTLFMVLPSPGKIDVTIAFSFDDQPGDLVYRDRVHLILSCR